MAQKDKTINPEILRLYRGNNAELKKQAAGRIVAEYGMYVKNLILTYYSSFAENYFEDMYHYGIIGLLESLDNYDGKHAFTTHSKLYIVHEISLFVCSMQGNCSTYYGLGQKKVKEAVQALQENGESIDKKQIAEMTGLSLKRVSLELRALKASELVYIDGLGNAGCLDLGLFRDNMDDVVINRMILSQLADEIVKLDGDEMHIIRRIAFPRGSKRREGMSRYLEDVAKERLLDKLRKKIGLKR